MQGEPSKRCGRCDQEKPLDDFAWKRRDREQRASYCRACQKVLMRAHYLANRDLYIERARRRNIETKLDRTKLLLAYFVEHPCADCGETDPVVLDFDHLGDKRFNVGERLIWHPWEQVVAEIAKCDVVCANCHRRRTAHRRPTVRLQLLTDAERAGGTGGKAERRRRREGD